MIAIINRCLINSIENQPNANRRANCQLVTCLRLIGRCETKTLLSYLHNAETMGTITYTIP